MTQYWLMKSEPGVYSIQDLAREQETIWDGVRNYQARNFLRQMQIGDVGFFYHSNTEPPGIVGTMTIAMTQIDDPSQFDPSSKYYDRLSRPEQPRWQTVRVKFAQEFAQIISLAELKEQFNPDELWVVRKGNRLSVMPVATGVAERIFKLAKSVTG